MYSLYLIILFFVVLIPQTLLFNYTNFDSKPIDLNIIFGKYHPVKLDYDVKEILGEMNDDGNMIFFLYSPENHFTNIFNSYVRADYSNIEVVNVRSSNISLEFMDKYNLPFADFKNLIINDSFNVKRLEDFNYIIIPDKIDMEYANFHKYHDTIINYIQKHPTSFSAFRQVQLKDINPTMLIFKIA